MALTIEALTQGLSGFGRADDVAGWGAAVFIQVTDPAAFAGAAAFKRQTSHVADAVNASESVPGWGPVRLPGERALARKRAALDRGLELSPGIIDALAPWARRAGIEPPSPI